MHHQHKIWFPVLNITRIGYSRYAWKIEENFIKSFITLEAQEWINKERRNHHVAKTDLHMIVCLFMRWINAWVNIGVDLPLNSTQVINWLLGIINTKVCLDCLKHASLSCRVEVFFSLLDSFLLPTHSPHVYYACYYYSLFMIMYNYPFSPALLAPCTPDVVVYFCIAHHKCW